jgi:hypothetical protein
MPLPSRRRSRNHLTRSREPRSSTSSPSEEKGGGHTRNGSQHAPCLSYVHNAKNSIHFAKETLCLPTPFLSLSALTLALSLLSLPPSSLPSSIPPSQPLSLFLSLKTPPPFLFGLTKRARILSGITISCNEPLYCIVWSNLMCRQATGTHLLTHLHTHTRADP